MTELTPQLLPQLLPLMTYCMVMSGTPGPNNMMLTASGANFGYRGALPQILGISSGVFVQTLLCCLGLASIFVAYPAAHSALRVGGALYLVYLAWKLTGASVGEAHAPRPATYLQGALFQAVNPKAWVRAITIASVFMPTGMAPLNGALLVSVISLVVGFPCISMWALFGVAIRHLLTDPRKQRAFNLLMAGTLLVLALMFLR